MMRWWWFGPAVTKPELEREMRLMKQGGIGGFEVQPTYALELDNPAKGIRNLPYMSDEFLEMLRFTGEKAKEIAYSESRRLLDRTPESKRLYERALVSAA